MSILTETFPWITMGKRDAAPATPSIETASRLPNEPGFSFERGLRTTPENYMKYQYRDMWVDPDVRQAILDVREMDRKDGIVKRIHGRVARDVVKGGLVLQLTEPSETLSREWKAFERRLQLNRREKLKSDARGYVMEGNLAMQWVLDENLQLREGVRMPSETILPVVHPNGRFKDAREAYHQYDLVTGRVTDKFPLWQLFLLRFDPDNFDDLGCLGRPFLDASRTTWKKLQMTNEDLVIRRRTRAPLRMSHVLEGASQSDVETYRAQVEKDQREAVTTDYYQNKKGAVTAVQGDAKLDEIKDIAYLMDCFFAGSPLPRGLMGFTEGLARDILEDIKRDYYDEIDELQDEIAFCYEAGFRLQLLLKGINPDAEEFWLGFAERRTETPTQTTDRALKWKALGMPEGMIWEEMGFNEQDVRKRRDYERKHYDPYPDPTAIGAPGGQRVSITPGNAPKKESATSVTNE